MWKNRLKSKSFTLAGLIFGFIGATLLALSVEIIDTWIPPPALTHATINPAYFWLGLGFLAFGFVLQAAGVVLEK